MRRISHILILSVLCYTWVNAQNLDSLLLLLEQPGSAGQDRYQLHFDLGSAYDDGEHEEYDKALYHYAIAHKMAKEQANLDREAESLFGMGECLQRKNEYQKALEQYSLIITLDNEQYESPLKASAYTQISAIYQALGDYESAYENQMKALFLYDLKNDSMGIANSHYNVGSIYFYQKQYEHALDHYQKAKDLCDVLNNDGSIYSCLAAMGSVNEKLGNHEKSLEYNTRALAIAEKLNYKTGIAYALGNIAANYLTQGELEKAEQFHKKSILLKLEVGDKWGAIGSNIDLSKLYLQWDKPLMALPFLEEALLLATQVDSKTRKPEIYQILAAVYDKMNDPIQAYAYTKKYITLKDSLINEKTLEEMGQSQKRYEVQKREHKITLLKKENEILGKNEEIRQQQFYIFAIAFVAFLMFLWWYKSKLNYQNKVNKLLGEKNSLLAVKNEEIHIKNKQLEHSNEDLQQFAYVASHDLKEPLRMINSYTTLLERRYKDMFDEPGKEFMHYIVDAVKRMETLLDDLLDFSRAGTQPAPTTFISLQDIMVIVEANLRHRLQNLNAKLIIKNENLPRVKAHRTMLIQLLQNLVSNGVKFKGAADPVVIVDCVQEDNQFVLSVKDNGIGISKENLEKVFEMFRRLHTRDEYEGTGIGLATCKRIVTTWGGDIWVESHVGEGSTFFFSFPVSVTEMELVAV